jgi:hypothetical protein
MSGFSAYGAGQLDWFQTYTSLTQGTDFWSWEDDLPNAGNLLGYDPGCDDYSYSFVVSSGYAKISGLSVRCIQDY